MGTWTSSWDILIPDPDGENADLWLEVRGQCEAGGMDPGRLGELEERLAGWYGIPFKLRAHTPEISAGNVETVFEVYQGIGDDLAPGTDVLFDITHGFRSMPVLIYQSLQLNAARLRGRRVHLIYGEYNEKDNLSHVRDLSHYWEYYEVSAAKRLFEEKLDGRAVAEKVEPSWKEGAACLRRWSDMVECNFSLQLPEVLRQMENALGKFTGDGAPGWVRGVRGDLRRIGDTLKVGPGERYPHARGLLKYAHLLESKGLMIQAIIALQVTVETAIAEKFDSSRIGEYEWFHGSGDGSSPGRRCLNEIKAKDGRVRAFLGKVEGLRNQIAHGGGKDRHTGSFPSGTALPGILKGGRGAMDTFFAILDGMDE
jgi:CRISPR-associated DxTHG motif protein